MTDSKKIVLVVTGSIAACKTGELVEKLQSNAYTVDVIFTKAAEHWQDKPRWITVEAIRQAVKGTVLTGDDALEAKADVIRGAGTILVAPASADIISQLCFESSNLARVILQAQRDGAVLCVAPAMNYKMWEHRTVQRNCAYLSDQGVKFLGPVEGQMACNDFGFGRMMQVDGIIDSLYSILEEMNFSSTVLFDMARKMARRRTVRKTAPNDSLLVVITGADIEQSDIEAFVAEVKILGRPATYVLDQPWHAYRDVLEKLTEQTVVTDHYQIDPEGLEHIKLPDQADVVVYPFVDDKLAQQLLEGATRTLGTDIYFASKAPVVFIPSGHATKKDSILSGLEGDGVRVMKNLQELKLRAR